MDPERRLNVLLYRGRIPDRNEFDGCNKVNRSGVESYAAARPSYPASLFGSVLAYHNAQSTSGVLLDIGCGHGLVARAMSPHFAHVVGIDTSPGMVEQAASSTQDANITFRQAGAEDLSFLDDEAVDMIVAGQSAHWFDYDKAWPELCRVLKPHGSLAFWGYRDNVLVGHEQANRIFDKYCYADGELEPGLQGMNAHWEQPGRNRIRNLLREVQPPEKDWGDIRRILYDVTPDCAQGRGPKRPGCKSGSIWASWKPMYARLAHFRAGGMLIPISKVEQRVVVRETWLTI
ncbi:hypothetical protein E4U54_002462 [Claviceps lovelessii]|nr:hypothetical protein E4U54_002462 [Claviceps lovelessii]